MLVLFWLYWRLPELLTIVLPVSSTILRVTRGAGSPRLRTTTTYKGYKRFLTGGRVVGDERSAR